MSSPLPHNYWALKQRCTWCVVYSTTVVHLAVHLVEVCHLQILWCALEVSINALIWYAVASFIAIQIYHMLDCNKVLRFTFYCVSATFVNCTRAIKDYATDRSKWSLESVFLYKKAPQICTKNLDGYVNINVWFIELVVGNLHDSN